MNNKSVAEFMISEIVDKGYVYQEYLVHDIQTKFGDEYVYENENGEQYPFKENLPLNGNECKIVIYDMPRTSKASLSSGTGSLNVESTTTFYGNSGSDNLKTKETWNIQNGGKSLKIDYSTSYSGGSATGVQYFDKIK